MKKDYKKRYKEIKRFVNFKIDLRKKLSTAEKQKISLYFNSISSITDSEFQVYSTTNRKNFKKALKELGAPKLIKAGLKAIPIKSEDKIKVSFDKKGNIKIKRGDYIETTTTTLNNIKLVSKGSESYLKRKFQKIKAGNANSYSFNIYGNKISPSFKSEKFLLDIFEEHVTKYLQAKPQAKYTLEAKRVIKEQNKHRHNFIYNRKKKLYECSCGKTYKKKTKNTY